MSHPSGPNSPYPGADATGSSRAINAASQTVGASASQTGNDDALQSPSSVAHHRHRRHNQPLAQHINKPLRRHEWSSRNRVWTRAALRRERIDFFDTRVTGRQEVWQTIHVALGVLWTADAAVRYGQHSGLPASEEADPAIALATAQTILDAADITLPTGDLAQGAYDVLGNYYSLPEHIVSDPLNISLRPEPADANLEDAKAGMDASEETIEDRVEDDNESERRREEKGKAVVDERDLITIRARLSDGSKDVNVKATEGENVRVVARRVAEQAQVSWARPPHRDPLNLAINQKQLAPNKKIRIAYMGRILKEGSPLVEQGWKQGHVINALVFNR